MEKALYHVLLEGRRIGPCDRRTIVGRRIKKRRHVTAWVLVRRF